jgi:NADH-quinone oxidoreductase subunit L
MDDEVNMRRYGGLRKFMPITFATFGLGYLAIIGVPPFAGFYSKDKIIEVAFNTGGVRGLTLGTAALLGAAITAFYMTRVVILTFAGKERWDEHAHPHESPILMWAPMVLLAIGSVSSGFLFTHGNSLRNWLAPVVEQSPIHQSELLKPAVVSILALVLVLVGVAISVLMYLRREVPQVAPENVSIFTRIARRDLLQDDFNEAVFMHPGQALTSTLVKAEAVIIDGAVRGVGRLTLNSGNALRKTQTGFVRSYALWILVGAVGLIAAIWVITQ